jgi:glutathione S-transferase
MSNQPDATLFVVPLSHPCMTVRGALDLKGIAFEEESVPMTEHRNHGDAVEQRFGEGRRKVPVLVLDGEDIHGSTTILRRLEEIEPSNPLYPEPIADAVREAETWGDEVIQETARRLPFAALHFRPGAMGTFAGGDELDPAGCDFAMSYVRAAWKDLEMTAVSVCELLAGLPAEIEKIESFAAEGLIDGDSPTAADFQIAPSARLLLNIGDLRPMLEGTAAERIAMRFFPDYPGDIPAGALPPSWLPS